MNRVWRRAAAGLIAGLVAGPLSLLFWYTFNHSISIDMDRGAPVVRGFYDEERAGDVTFAWTGQAASLNLPGLDRRAPWTCSVRLRGARPDPATLPRVSLSTDGNAVVSRQVANDWEDLNANIPPNPAGSGLVLTLGISNTFQPGPGDTRALGVMVDRWTCDPMGGGLVLPPLRALGVAAGTAGMFGLALAMIGVTPVVIAAATIGLAIAQAAVITQGVGLFTPYVMQLPWYALWICASLVALVGVTEARAGATLRRAARFVAAASAAILYLKLAALLHPSKPLVDAVFHAHRFDGVLAGKLYFVQPLAGGVNFPYAIGLYLFAAPWSILAHDHVTLLRVVVCTSEVFAGALLYLMVARTWADRRAGAVAVVLFSLTPISFAVVGNANLTNAFGQSAALIALVCVTLSASARRAWLSVVPLVAITTLALISHVSTAGLLVVTLGALAVFYATIGGRALRPAAFRVVIVIAASAALAFALYYSHFPEVYAALKMTPAAGAVGGVRRGSDPIPAGSDARLTPPPASPVAAAATAATTGQRMASAWSLTADAVGWPMLLLAAIGVWRVSRDGWRDRVACLIAAWLAAELLFVLVATLRSVGAGNERYAAEFVARAAYATYPAAVLLAARAAVWMWRSGWPGRAVSTGLLGWAVYLGAASWFAWLA